MTAVLLPACLALPLAMLVAGIRRDIRERMLSWLALAPLPAVAAALFAAGGPPLLLSPDRFRFGLALAAPEALLLGTAALLWSAAGAYAAAYLRGQPHGGRFAVFWLLTLTGSLGVFMADDLASFYLAFALVSIAAWGLVAHDGTARARRAGAIYLALAVLGEILLLAGFILLAVDTPGDTLAIADIMAALPDSDRRGPALVLLIAGFGLKAGLVPLHVWLPIAHPAAPMPASAVLSGAIIKAGVVGLIVFLPLARAMPDWGEALAALGLVTAFYGAAVGITQDNAKTVLAYSSVSQMGLTATVLGMAWAAGAAGGGLTVAFYAAHHVLVKGALFLAVGVVAATARPRLLPVLLPTALLALGIGGLPLTGGAVAKLAIKPVLGEGGVAMLAALSGVASTMLMLHFLQRLGATAGPAGGRPPPAGLVLPWLVMALAALVVPWALYPMTTGDAWWAPLLPKALWEAAWPVLLGVALTLLLRRWRAGLPHIPEGDVAVVGETAMRAAALWGVKLERLDDALGTWPATGLALLVLGLLLGFAMRGLG
ncbi:MAG TPA: proton-conducting transporter membrane subunit [Geminicoccaceae bacterium]|nr:proton-conducting transporter membrane subunit [Geminicoccus sp.]HMU48997.1 proton-conducting transporter membrane subunit [Geminicoccaceae bacterium]